MLIQKRLLEQLIDLASDSAEYLNEKWITVKPHGTESKGTHVLVKDGETSKEAIERKFGDETKSKKEIKPEDIGIIPSKKFDASKQGYGSYLKGGGARKAQRNISSNVNKLEKESYERSLQIFEKYKNEPTEKIKKIADDLEELADKEGWSEPKEIGIIRKIIKFRNK